MTGRRRHADLRIGHDQAVDLAQAFLGDLGVVDTSDTHCVRVAGELFLVRFRTAAEALKSVTVVAVAPLDSWILRRLRNPPVTNVWG